ncbi:MAG: helicase-associated domain-containing protein, partial [Actinomycetota bacterium]|nr:helicase-associated domain-containing protein [Actinomycetota bacterium]
LGPEAHWPPARGLRRDVLAELDAAGPGTAVPAATLAEALAWRRPRRLPPNLDTVVGAVLREAEWLGVTGRGALSDAGRALLREPATEELAATMHPHLPEPVEHIVLQADLTAIAPGPLEGGLSAFLRLVADVESRGGATVYRFTTDSVRRCLDAGWSVDQVLTALADASHTPVPQPLEYLVRDVARRHGQTRVGSVRSYVRCDDEATLGAMLADRELSALQLRLVAPTVLVSPVTSETVLDFLRDNGFAPVPETPEGGVVVPTAGRHRTPAQRRGAPVHLQPVDDDVVTALIGALRAGEESAAYQREQQASRRGPSLPSTDPTTTLAILREAAADRQGVWIGYSDSDGGVQRLLFYPERVEGGRVHGSAEGTARTLSIHRVTGAAAV